MDNCLLLKLWAANDQHFGLCFSWHEVYDSVPRLCPEEPFTPNIQRTIVAPQNLAVQF